jgi:adenylate kinase family enzyme
MKITPVKSKKEPDYPTIKEYTDHPELLSQNIPLSWIKNKYVATSLAAFILCGTPKDTDNIKAKPAIVFDESQKNKSLEENKSEKKDSVKIAPIFAHGEGSGATGCSVISPPVFISEEEAKKIIFDALKKANIEFDTVNCPIIEFVSDPIANSCYGIHSSDSIKSEVKLKMDGYNKQYNFAVQYVSTEDFKKFTSTYKTEVRELCGSSVNSFMTKKAADIIRDVLISKSNTNAVIFYDPIPYVEFEKREDKINSEFKAKDEAKKMLLSQVEDFIKWIKAEGILNK